MSVAKARSRVAVEVKKQKKSGADESSAVDAARRELAAEKLAQYIERTVASAPELTVDQRARLTALLQAAGASK